MDEPMTDTPLIRAAKAAMVASGCGIMRGGERVFCDACDCEVVARAVLEAVREPSEAMVAATDDHDNNWGYYADGRPSGPVDCWQAMIDAALSE